MRPAIALLLVAAGVAAAGAAASGGEPARGEAASGDEPARGEAASGGTKQRQQPASAVLLIAPCAWGQIERRVECGTLRVAEDRARPSARSISLFLVIVHATGRATDDPIFFFTGGPGSAASQSARYLTAEFASLGATRDFVFIDQRGTGRSAPLRCDFPDDVRAQLAPMFDAAQTAACRQKLEPSADLRFYTTTDAVLDVEDVRKALGYTRLNLHGSSYGSRAAWAYAARFPDRTRAMLLHGPAPPGFHLPIPFARGLDAAIDGVIADCARDTTCAARFPSLRADTRKAFDRLRAKPARVTVLGANGQSRDATLTLGELAEALRYQLYSIQGARGVPRLLTQAADGDYSPIAQASVDNRARLEQQLARGMFMSVTCAEDVPFMDEATIRATSSGTRLGDYRVRQQIAACTEWPRGEGQWWRAGSAGAPRPADRPSTEPLRVPTLVEVGEFDPATPLASAREGMKLLPNGRLVVLPHGAHGFGGLGLDDCIRRINNTFFARGSAKALDTSCVASAKRPPFDLR